MKAENRKIWNTAFGQAIRNSQLWMMHFESDGEDKFPPVVGLTDGPQLSFIEGEQDEGDVIVFTFAAGKTLSVGDPCAAAYVEMLSCDAAQLLTDGAYRLRVSFDGLDAAMSGCSAMVRIECLDFKEKSSPSRV